MEKDSGSRECETASVHGLYEPFCRTPMSALGGDAQVRSRSKETGMVGSDLMFCGTLWMVWEV